MNLNLACARFALETAIVSDSHMFISVVQIAAYFILTLYLDNVQMTVIVQESYGAYNVMVLESRMFLAAHGPRALMPSVMRMTITAFCPPAYQWARSTMLESVSLPEDTYVANAKETVTMKTQGVRWA